MKRNKEEMETDSKEKYFQSPPIVRECTEFVSQICRVVKEDSASVVSIKMGTISDQSIGDGTGEQKIVEDAEADAIFKRLKVELESQTVMKMYK